MKKATKKEFKGLVEIDWDKLTEQFRKSKRLQDFIKETKPQDYIYKPQEKQNDNKNK